MLFKTQLKSYSLEQVQSVGGSTINQIKDNLESLSNKADAMEEELIITRIKI